VGRWIHVLQKSSLAQARRLLLSAPAYRDLTPTQYEAALEWLVGKELVDQSGNLTLDGDQGGWLLKRALAEAVLDEAPPWLGAAAELISAPTELPVDLHEFASALGIPNDFRTLDAIWSASAKYNADRQVEVGLAAELALTAWLGSHANCTVTRVSAFDDTVGFDLEVVSGPLVAHVEVKGTTKTGSPSFFLSRNEFAVMRRDPNWCLQLVRLDADLALVELQWVDRAAIERAAPTNGSEFGRWESAQIRLSSEHIQDGPSPLLELLSSRDE
jgi:hypothetical protein